MNTKQIRENRISSIKASLKKMTIVSKNSIQIQARKEKIHSRRQSLQLAVGSLQSQTLMKKFSDEDEEEEKNHTNSFDEKYQLLEKIGEGGNGVVAKCKYIPKGKIYAVKIVKMQEEHYLELKRNFLNIIMLKHPSIIKYHALYFDLKKLMCYLIMEYFPFKNLIDLALKQQAQLRIVFSQVLSAINYIHQRNVCHRDIKPQNILYDPIEKRVKIIDFGISKKTFQRGQRRDMLTIIGTPFYMAPQILLGGGYDQHVDLWCIGITIYKLITDRTPFQSEYHGDTIDNILNGKVEFGTEWDNYSFLIKDLTSRLIKHRRERLSVKEALRHLWISHGSLGEKMRKLSQITEANIKFGRHESGTMQGFRAIMEQQTLKLKHASSKEEGAETIQNDKEIRFVKETRLKLMNNHEYELTDSGDEENSPETAMFKNKIQQ